MPSSMPRSPKSSQVRPRALQRGAASGVPVLVVDPNLKRSDWQVLLIGPFMSDIFYGSGEF